MATNNIYTLYQYDLVGGGKRYFIDLWGVPGKIEVTEAQRNAIITNAKKDYKIRYTDMSNPDEKPEGVESNYVIMYILS